MGYGPYVADEEPGPSPLDVPPGRYTAISVGAWHACAINEDAEVVCWGDNERGQTDAPAGRYTAVDAGSDRTCALSEAADIVCWGAATQGLPAVPPGPYSSIAGEVCGLRPTREAVC